MSRFLACCILGLLSCDGVTSIESVDSQAQSIEADVESTSLNVLDVAMGLGQTCAVSEAEDLRCFGSNADRLLGHWTLSAIVATPTLRVLAAGVKPLVLSDATAPGQSHSCASTKDGEVYCWGRSELGQTGQGTTTSVPHTPRKVPSLPGHISQVVNLKETSCALNDLGEVYCWGSNRSGLLGFEASPDSFSETPHRVETLPLSKLAGGGQTMCGVTVPSSSSDGVSTVLCWGDNSWGQSGLFDDKTILTEPRPVPFVSHVTHLAGDGSAFCATTESGALLCWGLNLGGLRSGDPNDYRLSMMASPIDIPFPARQVAVGSDLACAITDGDYVYCWGQARAMQDDIPEGSGVVARSMMMDPRGLPLKASTISTQFGSTCAVTVEKKLVCWGDQTAGRLGNGVIATTSNRTPFFVNFPRLP